MNLETLKASLDAPAPPPGLPVTIQALWWDARGDWSRAHTLVDDLETPDGMAVHAYLHRKEGDNWNADYWYRRAGRRHHRANLEDEWEALILALLTES